ncbi:MAG TPA: dihydrofolate reductase family protein [Leptospiraceae bacterium]|nr:dihydrofolate reductase family protein [Leptospiraceae bacterium]HNF14975.1 dihydrofolate reductase family protein [Leptospiraceae bacterium]HNF24347.1 dihydrofolate reductase family protein [Leptospiraceae bacterium]HNI94648.1 dihydrofolate reductase family protein [Leptospiraceae bacterium]HNM05001.1 dihydrofolate reductase family protein [Leptospiraceae bacterium]
MSNIKYSVFIAVSADGYIAGKDGALEWLSAVSREGEDYGYLEFFSTVDTLVMGRNTYEKVLSFGDWPYEKKDCIVLTKEKLKPRFNEKIMNASPIELDHILQKEEKRKVYLDGGKLISSFLAAGFVDEIILSVIPVLLGEGIPLFHPNSGMQALKLMHVKSFESGLVQMKYAIHRKKEVEV